jgi:hypothetical protein
MKRLFPAYLILAVALICGAYAAHSHQTAPANIRTVLDGKMLPKEEVATFERSETLYPIKVVHRGSVIRTLPVADQRLENVTFQLGDSGTTCSITSQ